MSLDLDGPIINNYVVGLLSDLTKTQPTEPVDSDRKNSPSCLSHLLLGGVLTVSPWSLSTLDHTDLTAYTSKDAPAYQIEFWNASRSIEWATHAGSMFGSSDAAYHLTVSSLVNPGEVPSPHVHQVCV